MSFLSLKKCLDGVAQFFCQPVKRTRLSTAGLSYAEDLESRQLLSATRGHQSANETVAVDRTTGQLQGESDIHNRSHVAPSYPNVAGTWNLQAAADIDNDPTLYFNGTALLTQKVRKVTGSVTLEGLPDFRIKGKLNHVDTFQLKGSTRFPVETSDDHFYFLHGSLSVHFAQDVTAFTGQVHRVIFGYHIDVTLSATKV